MVRDLEKNGCAEWVFREKKGVLNYTANAALPIAGIQDARSAQDGCGPRSDA